MHMLSRLACLAAVCALPAAAGAAPAGIAYAFTGPDGAEPNGLSQDGMGTVYGTTRYGGDPQCYCGTIFKLDHSGTPITLYTFSRSIYGANPQSGVTMIRGLLYGQASNGHQASGYPIYTIHPDGTGITFLHEVTEDEGGPIAGLLQPCACGGVFGVGTEGYRNFGSLFYLSQSNKFTIVHQFSAKDQDGFSPSNLIEDGSGNLFGSTSSGGSPSYKNKAGGCRANDGCGTLFEYVPKTRTYTVLYRFSETGPAGYEPMIGAAAPDGTLYGVTQYGGPSGRGTLFALTPANGTYTLSVLTPILSENLGNPLNPPSLSPNGTLFGSTFYGIYSYRDGVFSIKQAADEAASFFPYVVPANHPDAIIGTNALTAPGLSCDRGYCGSITYARQSP